LVGPGARRSERINSLTAGLFGEWHFSHQDFQLQGNINDNRFRNNDTLNNLSGSATLDWKWMLGHRLSGEVGADYSRALAGFTNNRYLAKDLLDTQGYFASFAYRTGTYWSLTGGAQSAVTTHSAYARGIDDSRSNSGKVGVEYRSRAGNVLGWDYGYTRGTYSQQLDLNGIEINPNYRQNTASMRFQYALTGKTSVQGSVGYLDRVYPDQLPGTYSPGFSGDAWRLAVNWNAAAKTSLVLVGWRELRAYLDAESNYFVSQGASITPAWAPTRKVQLKLAYSWEHQDYIGSSPLLFGLDNRKDIVSSGEFTASYQLFGVAVLGASIRHENRNSSRSSLEYRDNSMNLSIKLSH
jgi:hypothetical protein